MPAAQAVQLLQVRISAPCHHVVDGKRFPEKKILRIIREYMNREMTKRDTRTSMCQSKEIKIIKKVVGVVELESDTYELFERSLFSLDWTRLWRLVD